MDKEHHLAKIIKRYKISMAGIGEKFDRMIKNNITNHEFDRTVSIAEIRLCYYELLLLKRERESLYPRVVFDDTCKGIYLPFSKKCDMYLYDNGHNIYVIGNNVMRVQADLL
jgi:hypothetical protein